MPRPLALTVLAAVSTLALGACASHGAETSTATNSRNDELARLRRDCDARGGFLVPADRLDGRPQIDNYCRITGGASRIP